MAQPYCIMVHGGAGKYRDDDLAPRASGCERAARTGWQILQYGGSALDAVEAAVVALEDDPLFNAGTGAPLNSAGEVELDASIMDGATSRAGAVGAISAVRNPIRVARRLLDEGRHVLLVGTGAQRYALEQGLETCDAGELITHAQRSRWQERYGTVGAVALDVRGRLAAATSTGGLFGKAPGRVGDSALIGCGTFADERSAVSCTGTGEAIIRVQMARTAGDLVRAGLDPDTASRESLAMLVARTDSDAGLIVLDRSGRTGYSWNTRHMPVCIVDAGGEVFFTA